MRILIWIIIVIIFASFLFGSDDKKEQFPPKQPIGKTSPLERLKTNLTQYDDYKPWNRINRAAVVTEAAAFASSLSMCENALKSSDNAERELAKNYKQKIITTMKSELPKLREAYIKFLGQELWERDIEVTGFGKTKETIQLTGGVYAANRNKKETQEALFEEFRVLRFKKSEYRFTKYDDEYTYYTIDLAQLK